MHLEGQRVIVTRAAHQAGELVAALKREGARVELLPLIEIAPPNDPEPLERAATEIASYDWLVLTSPNAVAAFLPRLRQDAPRIAAVGPATAAAVQAVLGTNVEMVVAPKSDAEGLVERLGSDLVPGVQVLVPQADDARPTLVDGLRNAGAVVTRVDAYSKRLPEDAAFRAAELFVERLAWVTFTSPRIARHFFELLGNDWPARRHELRAVAIGRVTRRALVEHGVEDVVMAAEPTPEAMVRAMLKAT